MPTVDDILSRFKPAEKTVRINLDGQLAARIDQLRDELAEAAEHDKRTSAGLEARAPQISQEIMELRKRWREEASEFTFRAIPGADLDELIRQHPPTEEDWERFRKSAPYATPPQFDQEKIAPRLVAASLGEVDGETVDWTPEDAKRLWDSLHEGVRADLLRAAWAVNQRRSARPTSGTGTDEIPNSGPGSTTQQNTGSPSPSSTDES